MAGDRLSAAANPLQGRKIRTLEVIENIRMDFYPLRSRPPWLRLWPVDMQKRAQSRRRTASPGTCGEPYAGCGTVARTEVVWRQLERLFSDNYPRVFSPRRGAGLRGGRGRRGSN